MKKCLYCGEKINQEDDFEKVGRKYVCVLCYDDYLEDLDQDYPDNETNEDFYGFY